MKFYKFLILFFASISLFLFTNLSQIQGLSSQNTPLTIKIITPSKSQDYIISKPTIKARFISKTKINTSSVKLYLNNKDVTKNAKITKNEIEYTPTKKLSRGTQIVKITASDKSQNKVSLEWYFTVGTPIYQIQKGSFIDFEDIKKTSPKVTPKEKSSNTDKSKDSNANSSKTSNSDSSKEDSFENLYKKFCKNDIPLKSNDFFIINNYISNSKSLESSSISNAVSSKSSSSFSDLNSANSSKSHDDFKISLKKKNKNVVLLNCLKINSTLSKSQFTIYNFNKSTPFKNIENLSPYALYKNLFYRDELICSFNPISNDLNLFEHMKYSSYGDSVFSLIDITNFGLNLENSNEFNEKNTDIYDSENNSPFYLKNYNYALDNGWHVSPISYKYTTNLLCTNKSTDAILNALKNRRSYVSNNPNLNLEFKINSSTMGTIIQNPSKLNFNISCVDLNSQNKIEDIYVISNNGKTIKNIKPNSYLAKCEFTLKEFSNLSYYYVIIKQSNQKITISSPIWVTAKL